MRYLNGAMGLIFLALAALQLAGPTPLWSLYFVAGAVLAFADLKSELSLWTVRILAVSSTLAMFLYFGGFFGFVELFEDDKWYNLEGSTRCMSLLAAGFCMIPVLSEFTWRMKAASDHRISQDRPLPGVRI
jgi:hypothetical protein